MNGLRGRRGRDVLGARRRVRQQLEATRRLQAVEAGEVHHPRGATVLDSSAPVSSHGLLVLRRMKRSTLMPHVCLSPAGKRSCDSGIRISTDQPSLVRGDLRLPDGVPAPVVPGVVEEDGVGLHVRGADAEHHAGQMVVHRIEIERDAIGVAIAVARRETTADLRRLAVEQARADIERAVVVEHPDFGALGRGLAFVRIPLREIGEHLRLRPRFIVQLAVDGGRLRACGWPGTRG